MSDSYEIVKMNEPEAYQNIVAFASIVGFPLELSEKMRAQIEGFCMEQVAKQIAKR